MSLLIDTNIAIWADLKSRRLSPRANEAIEATDRIVFSVVSLWEVVIKRGLDRPDFQRDPRVLRRSLLNAGYEELQVSAEHVFEVAHLPRLHNDPFDRLLLAQARSEGLTLLTTDAMLDRYGAPVMRV